MDFSISGLRLSLFVDSCSPLPEEIVVDNGPELTSKAMFLWSERAGMRLRFIGPGKPMQNAFVESSNARFRDTRVAPTFMLKYNIRKRTKARSRTYWP